MASNATIIGRATRVRGRLTGASDVDVQGFVEGEIDVTGDVTIDANGMVGATVQGRKVVVRGAVKGDLTGQEAVLLEDGARVVGDIRAPRVAIAPGALVRGFVQTFATGAAGQRVARAPAAVASPAPKQVARPQQAQPARAPVAVIAKPAAAAASGRTNASHAGGAHGARRPPPPIVPALRKAKGQLALKKKER
jgi:cytoskeletal protein CcmA (bactofilin family)